MLCFLLSTSAFPSVCTPQTHEAHDCVFAQSSQISLRNVSFLCERKTKIYFLPSSCKPCTYLNFREARSAKTTPFTLSPPVSANTFSPNCTRINLFVRVNELTSSISRRCIYALNSAATTVNVYIYIVLVYTHLYILNQPWESRRWHLQSLARIMRAAGCESACTQGNVDGIRGIAGREA